MASRALSAVRKALSEITVPLIGSTITPVVVFLPLISVSGVTGSFFRALAITMTASLLTSLMLALDLDAGAEPCAAARTQTTTPMKQQRAQPPAASWAAYSRSIIACSTGRWPSRSGSALPACCW